MTVPFNTIHETPKVSIIGKHFKLINTHYTKTKSIRQLMRFYRKKLATLKTTYNFDDAVRTDLLEYRRLLLEDNVEVPTSAKRSYG